jgi:hypothetical protein
MIAGRYTYRPELVWGFRCQVEFTVGVFDFLGGQSRPQPRGGTIAMSASRSRSTNSLKGFGGGTIAQAVGQRIMPSGVLSLQRERCALVRLFADRR